MKANIGPYVNYIGPYQIAEKFFFWLDKTDPLVLSLGKRLKNNLFLEAICKWVYQKRTRKIEIKFENYDFYNLSHTLALIILPALQEMKEYCFFYVSDTDVPQLILQECSHLNDETRSNFKCQWLMNEFIWTFEKIIEDTISPKEEAEKIAKNLILFGKYYRHLWT